MSNRISSGTGKAEDGSIPRIAGHASSSRTHASGRSVELALSCSVFTASLGTSIANVTLPTLCNEFQSPYSRVQWVMLTYLLSLTCCAVLAGRWGDLWGKKRTLLLGSAAFLAGSLLCALSPNLEFLVVARGLQGVGASIMMVMGTALITETSHSSRPGTALGLLATMSALGTALGPPLGGLLLALYGWRSIYVGFVVLVLAQALLTQLALPSHSSPIAVRPRTPDYRGGLFLVITLSLICLSLSAHHTFLRKATVPLLLGALVSALLFVRVERQHSHPILALEQLTHFPTMITLATHALVTAIMMTTLIIGPFYLSHVLHLPHRSVGLALALGPSLTALLSVAAGKWVDRRSPTASILTALGGMIVGCIALPFLAAHAGLPGYLGGIGWITAHYALFQTANQAALFKNVPPSNKGVMSGLLTLSRNLGLLAGTAALGIVFHSDAPPTSNQSLSSPLILSVMQETFHIAALLLVAAVLLQHVSRRKATEQLQHA